MIMRELTGGLYFGREKHGGSGNGVLVARDELTYSETEIRRIAKRGFDIAMKRRKKVTSVDKGECSGFFQTVEKGCGGSGERVSGSDAGAYAG